MNDACAIGPWQAQRIAIGRDVSAAVVLLHGYGMCAEDLIPFAHSLGARASFYIPQAPLALQHGKRAWWETDSTRVAQIKSSPRDLSDLDPPRRAPIRAQLAEFLHAVRRREPSLPLIVAGFSQGAMLASDHLFFDRAQVDGLALWSASCIAIEAWKARRGAAHGLAVSIAHGRFDPDLAFAAGERLRDFFIDAGAKVTWVPFDGGHEIPLVVWRSLKQMIAKASAASSPGTHAASTLPNVTP